MHQNVLSTVFIEKWIKKYKFSKGLFSFMLCTVCSKYICQFDCLMSNCLWSNLFHIPFIILFIYFCLSVFLALLLSVFSVLMQTFGTKVKQAISMPVKELRLIVHSKLFI